SSHQRVAPDADHGRYARGRGQATTLAGGLSDERREGGKVTRASHDSRTPWSQRSPLHHLPPPLEPGSSGGRREGGACDSRGQFERLGQGRVLDLRRQSRLVASL